MVRKGGLEPPRVLPHRILNPARLPIPPLARGVAMIVPVAKVGRRSGHPAGRMSRGSRIRPLRRSLTVGAIRHVTSQP